MEENTNIQENQQEVDEQPVEEKPKGLMPGQEHEDELDYMGGALFALVGNAFNWIKQFFVPKKVE